MLGRGVAGALQISQAPPTPAAAIESYRKALTLFENVAREKSADVVIKAQSSEAHKKLGLGFAAGGR